jgi:hypothetical protein
MPLSRGAVSAGAENRSVVVQTSSKCSGIKIGSRLQVAPASDRRNHLTQIAVWRRAAKSCRPGANLPSRCTLVTKKTRACATSVPAFESTVNGFTKREGPAGCQTRIVPFELDVMIIHGENHAPSTLFEGQDFNAVPVVDTEGDLSVW